MFTEEYIPDDVLKKIKIPRVEQKLMRTFSEEEITKILEAFDLNTYLGIRNLLIMVLLYDTGIRRKELVGIKIKDISLQNGLIKVFGRG